MEIVWLVIAITLHYVALYSDTEKKSYLEKSINGVLLSGVHLLFYKAGFYVYFTGYEGTVGYFIAVVVLQVVSILVLVLSKKASKEHLFAAFVAIFCWFQLGAYNNFALL